MALKTHRNDGGGLGTARGYGSVAASERLARMKAEFAKSEIGALLCFDMNNVRYITATHIGTWAQDEISPLHPAGGATGK